MKLLRMISLILVVVSGLSACTSENGGTTGGNPYSEDVSVSGASAQALGGALSASASGGLQASYQMQPCLLYTSDAADERSRVDLGGRRVIKKKKKTNKKNQKTKNT